LVVCCRDVVKNETWYKDADKKRQDALDQCLDAPKVVVPPPEGDEGAAPAAGSAGGDAMAVDITGQPLPELTTNNPGKLLKKLRRRRLAESRGLQQQTKKRSKPLAGSNQFHKKKKRKGGR
jgi:hypothetical protein